MDEIAELMAFLFRGNRALGPMQRFSYQEIFQRHTGLDPLAFSYQDYCAYARDNQLSEAVNICEYDHGLWLDLFSVIKFSPI